MSRTLETIIKKALSGYAEIVNFDKPDKTLGAGDARYTEWYIALADNQAITMRLTTKGEIYQVLVNGKLMPIRNQDEPEKAIQEVINRLTKERSAIIKKNSVTKVIDPPTKKERKSTLQTLTEKRDDLKVKIADAKAFLGVDEKTIDKKDKNDNIEPSETQSTEGSTMNPINFKKGNKTAYFYVSGDHQKEIEVDGDKFVAFSSRKNVKKVDADLVKDYPYLSSKIGKWADIVEYRKQSSGDAVVYLNVPFDKKDEAKKGGAKWDRAQSKWYIDGSVPDSLKKFLDN